MVLAMASGDAKGGAAGAPSQGRLSLSTDGDKYAMVNFFGGGGMNKKLLKQVFALYSLPIIFSKNFLTHYARSIAFYPQLTNASMQCVLPTPFVYFFHFLVSLSLTACFQNSLKTLIKLHKIAHKMSKNCSPGWGGWGW